jgi:hypothetical protein
MLATVSDVAAIAPWAFTVGVLTGLLLSRRYAIVRRDGGRDAENCAMDSSRPRDAVLSVTTPPLHAPPPPSSSSYSEGRRDDEP